MVIDDTLAGQLHRWLRLAYREQECTRVGFYALKTTLSEEQRAAMMAIEEHLTDAISYIGNALVSVPKPSPPAIEAYVIPPPRTTGDEWMDAKVAECVEKEQKAAEILDRIMQRGRISEMQVDWDRFHKLVEQKVGKRTLGAAAKLLGIKPKELEELAHEQVTAAFFKVCEKLEIEPKSLVIEEKPVEQEARPDTPLNLLVATTRYLERLQFEDDEEKANRLALLNRIYPVLRREQEGTRDAI